jgi:hypothetical protein
VRSSALLLVLAAALPAAERTPLSLEELGGPRFREQPVPSSHLFLLRSGVQVLASDTSLALNDASYTLSANSGNRVHAEGLLLIQPYQMRPGLMLGLGFARTYWSLGEDAGMTLKSIAAHGGLVMPLTRSNEWRIELLGYLGAAQAMVGDSVVNSQATEQGLDLGLVFPLYRPWGLEGGLTIGRYWNHVDPVEVSVTKAGTSLPAEIDFSTQALSYGFSLTWRP